MTFTWFEGNKITLWRDLTKLESRKINVASFKHPTAVRKCVFSKGCKYLATYATDGVLRVFMVSFMDVGCSRCTLGKVLDSYSCYLPWFRLLVVTPWWQNIVTVAWYLFRQASTNVIGLQSRAQSPLSVTAWAQAASTKVGYSIITHWPGRLPVYSYGHTSLCQISRKLLTKRIPVTVFWVIVAPYKITFKLKDTWKWYFTKIETHQGDNIKP